MQVPQLNVGSILTTSLTIKVVTALVASLCVWWSLRILDKLSGWRFTHVFDVMANDARALALYLGLRILAICLLWAILLA